MPRGVIGRDRARRRAAACLVGVGVRVEVGVGVRVEVGVGVGVGVRVWVGVEVKVKVGVRIRVWVGVGVRVRAGRGVPGASLIHSEVASSFAISSAADCRSRGVPLSRWESLSSRCRGEGWGWG